MPTPPSREQHIDLPDYSGPAYIHPEGKRPLDGTAPISVIAKQWLLDHPTMLGLMLWLAFAIVGGSIVYAANGW